MLVQSDDVVLGLVGVGANAVHGLSEVFLVHGLDLAVPLVGGLECIEARAGPGELVLQLCD